MSELTDFEIDSGLLEKIAKEFGYTKYEARKIIRKPKKLLSRKQRQFKTALGIKPKIPTRNKKQWMYIEIIDKNGNQKWVRRKVNRGANLRNSSVASFQKDSLENTILIRSIPDRIEKISRSDLERFFDIAVNDLSNKNKIPLIQFYKFMKHTKNYWLKESKAIFYHEEDKGPKPIDEIKKPEREFLEKIKFMLDFDKFYKFLNKSDKSFIENLRDTLNNHKDFKT